MTIKYYTRKGYTANEVIEAGMIDCNGFSVSWELFERRYRLENQSKEIRKQFLRETLGTNRKTSGKGRNPSNG